MEVVRRQRGLLDRQNAFSSNYTGVARRPFYGRVTSRQPVDRSVSTDAAGSALFRFALHMQQGKLFDERVAALRNGDIFDRASGIHEEPFP